jgi:2-dehydro-3-deoxyphosphogluconate aldolase/(4S)-4-hydroxy-2-oxoglutarate aldolase
MEGGLPVAEVTFRTASAAQSIKRLRKELPSLLVGAGTVLTLAQAESAVEAGASFAVTPGFNPRIVEFFISKGIPVVPGVNSPTQVEMGLERGLQVLKFFPAEASGGTKMLKALYGPYAEVRFVPTGGIDAGNLADYLRLPNVVACGGSWMVKEDYIRQGRFADIAAACHTAVELAASCRIKN